MFRSGRRYQKQTRDAIRKQGRPTLVQHLEAYAAQGQATAAARAAAEDAAQAAELAASQESMAAELERMSILHDRGVLTDDEYTAAKRRIINRP